MKLVPYSTKVFIIFSYSYKSKKKIASKNFGLYALGFNGRPNGHAYIVTNTLF